jgi:FKBP-type peptidyl-prolyl cis-trans isomerase (trigger factor)
MSENIIEEASSITPGEEQKIDKKSIKISKKLIIIISIIIALGILAWLAKGLFVAAIVDGSPISRASIVQKLEKEAGKNLLESLVIEKLIQNEAKIKQITVSDEEINAEIKKIETQITSQGDTMDNALAAQNMTIDDLKEQIVAQKELEKLLADKVVVSDEEVAKYIADNQVPVTAGQEATINEQIKNELRNQKLNSEATTFIASLKAKAKIQYWVNY